MICSITRHLGTHALSKDQYSEALQYFSESLKWMVEHFVESQWQHLGKLSFNMGKCLKQLNMDEYAKDYLKKSVEVSTKVQWHTSMITRP